jgi:hypothetical protein
VSNSGIYITWPQLLYVGILVLSFYIAELVFFWLRHGRKNKTQDVSASLQAQIESLRQELDGVKVRMAALSRQLQAAEENENPFLSPTTSVLAKNSDSTQTDSPYAQAIRLAQQGADAPEVAITCGISRGEADLIVAIYRSAERS